MKKFLKITGIVIGALLLITLLALSSVYWYSGNYPEYSLFLDRERYPDIETSEDIDRLVDSWIGQMSFEEKVNQLSGEPYLAGAAKMAGAFFLRDRFPHVYAGRNARLGIPPFVLSDGPRGARVLDKEVEGVTVFPVAMARGASWDVSLESRINTIIAREMRANGTNYAATPCINLLRHPGWGRAQETYGEDPWLLGQFGVAAVRAIQQEGVMACPKHYALNSIENSRFFVDVQIDERALREVYLPHFRKAIVEGEAVSMMTAYNQVRGEYMAENTYLNREILRNEWGFEGFLTSDWFYGTYDGVSSIQGGLNVEMPVKQVYTEEALKKGIEDGRITENEIDELVAGTLKSRIPYAMHNNQAEYPLDLIASSEHTALAREAAEKSMVLLRNQSILPYRKDPDQKIAVIGRLADIENTGDQGSSNAKADYVITPLEGIRSYAKQINSEVRYHNGENIDEARKVAREADEVVLVVGYTYKEEGEYIVGTETMKESALAGELIGEKGLGGDRDSLDLLPSDIALIEQLSKETDRLVVVYVGGSAIDMRSWNEEVSAILFSWYAGMEGGNALATILWGDVNPSGKLPFTIARNQKDYPLFEPFTMETQYGYYHGYTLFDKEKLETLYPFGYGLSYTKYEYDSLNLETRDSVAYASIIVSNTGQMAGEEIVQFYVGFSNSAVDRTVKLLRDFKKVFLKPGESKKVDLKVNFDDLRWYDPESKKWNLEKMTYEAFVGSSSAERDLLKSSFRID